MNCRLAAYLLCGFSTIASAVPARGQCPSASTKSQHTEEPPGRDLFIPYVHTPDSTVAQQLRDAEQLRVLAEINKLTVELVKRRSNRYLSPADTPQLVKRLKRLAKELEEQE